METAVNAETEQTSRQQTSQNQTLRITTRVADICVTGMIASGDQCESSDEEVIEALSLCNPHDSCKTCLSFMHCLSFV